MTYLWIALGGAIGTLGRYVVSTTVSQRLEVIPAGTFVVNVTGSLLIGFLAVIFHDHTGLPPDLRRFVIIGVLGGYTTFSTLAWDTARYVETGELAHAAMNALGTIVVGVIAVFAGMALARAI